jgi:penicillin-insensitive murein DD-endopeptidase
VQYKLKIDSPRIFRFLDKLEMTIKNSGNDASVLIIFFVLFLLTPAPLASKTIWETQHEPAKGKAEIIGTYNNGCIIGAEQLPEDGYGWQLMRPSRNRSYAHREMMEYISALAKIVKYDMRNVLIIGDIGLPKGGPFNSGHRSHQTGIDADIWLATPPAALNRRLSAVEREQINAVNMVDNKTKTVNQNFGKYQKELLKTAANFAEVDKIFVNPAIKKEMCNSYKGELWLGKLRPWWGHDHHFHVRLECPADSPDCVAGAHYPSLYGDGCDKTLDWWFKERTKEELADMEKAEKEKKKLKLPKRCLELL